MISFLIWLVMSAFLLLGLAVMVIGKDDFYAGLYSIMFSVCFLGGGFYLFFKNL